jgi:glycine/D-amino acid oxidase-like deaminating enzyme
MAEMQDLVVIGGGAGGFAAAMRAAQLGGRVTVVEGAHYGGNCMNRACIPLTFLMAAGHTVECARRADRFGVEIGPPRVDMRALHDRKDLIIEGLRLGTEQLLAEYGITLIEGRGKIPAPAGWWSHRRSAQGGQTVEAPTSSSPLVRYRPAPVEARPARRMELRTFWPRSRTAAILGSLPWDPSGPFRAWHRDARRGRRTGAGRCRPRGGPTVGQAAL